LPTDTTSLSTKLCVVWLTISLESQCKEAYLGKNHDFQIVEAIPSFTLRLDLSAVAYDVATLLASPPNTSVMALVSADCCAGEIFILVAKDTIFGD